jgi:hypothetical protein
VDLTGIRPLEDHRFEFVEESLGVLALEDVPPDREAVAAGGDRRVDVVKDS